ncbi:MAG TPA: PQQ-binding-like beta-propeller repeat protein, partial [Bacteroidia bacterium]|nr:PQQ-binding-like beta-propeller repeat protein [Bacteroidia bacterium]
MKTFMYWVRGISMLFFAFSITNQAGAQVTTFQKYYGGSGEDYVYDLHKTSDGGYLYGALTTSFPGPWVRSWIVKTDVNGDTLWTSVFGDTTGGGSCDQQYINDITPVTDGGAVCCGGKGVCGDSTKGGNIVRVDAMGKVKWIKYFPTYCDPYPVIQCTDGNFVTGGYITNGGFLSPEDAFLTKLDSATGDTIWSKRFGGASGNEWFYHILQTADGGYLAAGYTTSFGQGGKDIYLVKTDANGILMWSKTYGTAKDEYAFGHCLEPTSDGGYIITGPEGTGKKGTFLLKIDANGNILWSKVYDGAGSHGIRQTADGGYVISGANAIGNVLLIRTDGTGNVIWSESYGQGAGNVVELAGDGGYITGGQIDAGPFGKKDIYIIKTDSTGNSGCNQAAGGVTDSIFTFISTTPPTTTTHGSATASYSYASARGGSINTGCLILGTADNKIESERITIYPNPAINNTTISFGGNGIHNAKIYDITGRKVGGFICTDRDYTFSCGE